MVLWAGGRPALPPTPVGGSSPRCRLRPWVSGVRHANLLLFLQQLTVAGSPDGHAHLGAAEASPGTVPRLRTDPQPEPPVCTCAACAHTSLGAVPTLPFSFFLGSSPTQEWAALRGSWVLGPHRTPRQPGLRDPKGHGRPVSSREVLPGRARQASQPKVPHSPASSRPRGDRRGQAARPGLL